MVSLKNHYWTQSTTVCLNTSMQLLMLSPALTWCCRALLLHSWHCSQVLWWIAKSCKHWTSFETVSRTAASEFSFKKRNLLMAASSVWLDFSHLVVRGKHQTRKLYRCMWRLQRRCSSALLLTSRGWDPMSTVFPSCRTSLWWTRSSRSTMDSLLLMVWSFRSQWVWRPKRSTPTSNIEASMVLTPSENNKMIFCCCSENFNDFKFVPDLVSEVKQYKMLCNTNSNPSKKQRTWW